MSIKYDWFWHHERDYTFSLSSAMLFGFKSEEDARMFNDAVMSIFYLGAPQHVALRSSLVNLDESKLLVKEVV